MQVSETKADQRLAKPWLLHISTLLQEQCVECFEFKKKFVAQRGVSWKSIYETETETQFLCSIHQGTGLKAEANAVMLAYEREQGQLDFVYFCDDEIESEKYIF